MQAQRPLSWRGQPSRVLLSPKRPSLLVRPARRPAVCMAGNALVQWVDELLARPQANPTGLRQRVSTDLEEGELPINTHGVGRAGKHPPFKVHLKPALLHVASACCSTVTSSLPRGLSTAGDSRKHELCPCLPSRPPRCSCPCPCPGTGWLQGKVLSVKRLGGRDRERDVTQIVIDTGGVKYVEGQAFGVVPPGWKRNSRGKQVGGDLAAAQANGLCMRALGYLHMCSAFFNFLLSSPTHKFPGQAPPTSPALVPAFNALHYNLQLTISIPTVSCGAAYLEFAAMACAGAFWGAALLHCIIALWRQPRWQHLHAVRGPGRVEG